MEPAPPRSSRQGLIIAVVAVIGLASLAGLVLSAVAWMKMRAALKDEKGQAALETFGRSIDAMQQADLQTSEGPAIDALKKAGCAQPVVVDPTALLAMMGELFDAGAGLAESGMGDPNVACMGPDLAALPGCAEVARVYAGAARPKGRFLASVCETPAAIGEEPNCRCQQRYEPDGTAVAQEPAQ